MTDPECDTGRYPASLYLVLDRESNRSEKKTGLSQKFSLFMRSIHATYPHPCGLT